jgi:hypothetical protein
MAGGPGFLAGLGAKASGEVIPRKAVSLREEPISPLVAMRARAAWSVTARQAASRTESGKVPSMIRTSNDWSASFRAASATGQSGKSELPSQG